MQSKKKAANRLLILLFVSVLPHFLSAQTNDTSYHVNKKRLRSFVIGTCVGYGVTMVGLSQLWYSNSPSQPFQFFNDNTEWKQVDKLGHFYSAFYLSYGTSRALQWCNLAPRKADLIGSLTGFLLMVPIEILDGHAQAYGASGGDLLADAAGAAFYAGQSLLWKEVRIYPKFSFHHTDYPSLRPDVLGSTWSNQILKDYNGQTYWLSVDMDKFLKFPKWLNLAVGYGAESMVYARDGQNQQAGYSPYRQYYLSLDFDLTAIKTRSKAIRSLIFFVNMIKIPSPTIEFSQKGARFHAFYF